MSVDQGKTHYEIKADQLYNVNQNEVRFHSMYLYST